MGSTIDLLRVLGAETLAGFWVPLLAWTALVLASLALLHVWRSAHPLVQYAGRLALLVALPAGLITAWTVDLPIMSWGAGDGAAGSAATSSAPLSEVTLDAPLSSLGPSPVLAVEKWLPLVGSLTMLVVIAALGAAAYTIRNALLLVRMRRQLLARPAKHAVQEAVACRARLRGIDRPIRAFITEMDVPPITFGCWRPVMVIPESVLEDDDAFHMSVCHELVHIGRYDDLFQKAELLIGSLFAAHPVVAWLRRSITYYRELSCDAAVLAEPEVSLRRYAALLYGFAAADPLELRPSLSMSATQPELIRRISAMQHHLQIPKSGLSHQRTALLLSPAILAAVTLIVACSDTVAPQAEALTPEARTAEEAVFVVVQDMPELVGGLSLLQASITYPETAKEAGVEGTVKVQATIDPEGLVSEATVIEGIGAELDEEALRAIRAARFKPGKQRGRPVETTVVIPIGFARGESPSVEGVGMQEDRMQVEEIDVDKGIFTGRVVASETELPLPGANVILEGTAVGTVSGPDGRFTLQLDKVPEAERLVVSYVGYAPVAVKL